MQVGTEGGSGQGITIQTKSSASLATYIGRPSRPSHLPVVVESLKRRVRAQMEPALPYASESAETVGRAQSPGRRTSMLYFPCAPKTGSSASALRG